MFKKSCKENIYLSYRHTKKSHITQVYIHAKISSVSVLSHVTHKTANCRTSNSALKENYFGRPHKLCEWARYS